MRKDFPAKYYYHPWLKEEEDEMTAIMEAGMQTRKKVVDLYEEVAAKLERTPQSCKNRWHAMQRNKAKESAKNEN